MQKVFITSVPRGIFYHWKKEREQAFYRQKRRQLPPARGAWGDGKNGSFAGRRGCDDGW